MYFFSASLKMLGMTMIVFFYAVLLLRLAKSRVHLKTPFDFVIIILIGSLLSRPINGEAEVFPTFVATLGLILIHRLMSYLTYRSSWLGTFLKGRSDVLVEDGEIYYDALRQHRITEDDLLEIARKNQILNIKDVKMACLERDGTISVIGKKTSNI